LRERENSRARLLVNGLNASDPASGNFRLNLPIDSVESVQVFQHPYTAEYECVYRWRGGGGEPAAAKTIGISEVNDFLPICGSRADISAVSPRTRPG